MQTTFIIKEGQRNLDLLTTYHQPRNRWRFVGRCEFIAWAAASHRFISKHAYRHHRPDSNSNSPSTGCQKECLIWAGRSPSHYHHPMIKIHHLSLVWYTPLCMLTSKIFITTFFILDGAGLMSEINTSLKENIKTALLHFKNFRRRASMKF